MIEHFARHWGDWASVVGLVFSILAFVFSKRASKAAREARDSVLQQTFGQDMNDANRAASEVLRFAGMNRLDIASLRASDLMDRTTYFIARWKDKLPEDATNNLLRAQELLLSIQVMIAKLETRAMTPSQKVNLSRACQQVSLIFSEQHGNAVRGTDREA